MKSETQRADEGSPKPGPRRMVTDHPRAAAALGLAVVAFAITGFLWFRPDKLVTDTLVDESIPSEQTSGAAITTETTVLSRGQFRDLEHETKGTAKILETSNGRTYLRLEGFSTSSGPDVIVILSDTPATESEWSAYDDGEFVALGALKGNKGDQNYAIPDDVDLTAYKSVVIWCRRFNVAFGAAPLSLEG